MHARAETRSGAEGVAVRGLPPPAGRLSAAGRRSIERGPLKHPEPLVDREPPNEAQSLVDLEPLNERHPPIDRAARGDAGPNGGRARTVSSRLAAPPDPAGVVTVDCGTCEVRGHGCADCVVALLLGPPEGALTFDSGQARALDVLAGCGLVPPLRHTGAVADRLRPLSSVQDGAEG